MPADPTTTTSLDHAGRAAIYLRVSGGPGQSVDSQRPDVVRMVRQRGLDIVKVYEESASAAGPRPVWDQVLLDAHRGEFDALGLWSLDRAGRSLRANIDSIMTLDSIGVRVLSVNEPWLDTAGPVRSLLIAIFSWVAEQERRRIGERVRAGLARAKAKGVRVGRPRAKVDVDRLVALREAGHSYRQIGRAVGLGASTVHRILAAHETVALARPETGASRMASKTAEPLVTGGPSETFTFGDGDE